MPPRSKVNSSLESSIDGLGDAGQASVSVRWTPWFPFRREGVMIPGLSWTTRCHRYPIHLSGQAA